MATAGSEIGESNGWFDQKTTRRRLQIGLVLVYFDCRDGAGRFFALHAQRCHSGACLVGCGRWRSHWGRDVDQCLRTERRIAGADQLSGRADCKPAARSPDWTVTHCSRNPFCSAHPGPGVGYLWILHSGRTSRRHTDCGLGQQLAMGHTIHIPIVDHRHLPRRPLPLPHRPGWWGCPMGCCSFWWPKGSFSLGPLY